MKKFLLILAGGLMLIQGVVANEIEFYYTQSGDAWKYGDVRRISENGKYAVATDMDENTGSILIDTDNMSDPIYNNDGEFWDVSNDGVICGVKYNVIGQTYYFQAAYYKDGAWFDLPLPEDRNPQGRSWATDITPDGKVISGYIAGYEKGTKENGKWFPAQWFLNEESQEYELVYYNTLVMPDNQGFVVMDASNDGRIMVGTMYTNFGNLIPAMVVDGELKYWNELKMVEFPFEYKGQIIGYDEDMVIDGYREISDSDFFGSLFSIDDEGFAYGCRTVVSDLDAENYTGTLTNYACIYDSNTDTFVDTRDGGYQCGKGGKVYFDGRGNVYIDGVKKSINSEFGIEYPMELQTGGITSISKDGKFLGGAALWFNDAIGEYEQIAMLIKLDKPLFGDDPVDPEDPGAVETVNSENVKVVVLDGVISVAGASNVAVYSMSGAQIGSSNKTAVDKGVYIVRANGKAFKVLVK